MTATISFDPLTTYEPPTSCFDQIWFNNRKDIVLGNPYDTACKPPGWNTGVVYSPALCPTSYYDALIRISTTNGLTETVIDCCPSSFAHDIGTYSCLSQIKTAASVVFYTYSSNDAIYSTALSVTGQGVNAHSIQVRYQSADLASLTDSNSPTSSTSLGIGSTAIDQSSAPTPTSRQTSEATAAPASQSHQGLSTGAKAGLGVGIVLGIFLIAGIVWIGYRTRKKKQQRDPSVKMTTYDKQYPHEKSRYEAPDRNGLAELEVPHSDRTGAAELPDRY